jgi:hypothetical protein
LPATPAGLSLLQTFLHRVARCLRQRFGAALIKAIKGPGFNKLFNMSVFAAAFSGKYKIVRKPRLSYGFVKGSWNGICKINLVNRQVKL